MAESITFYHGKCSERVKVWNEFCPSCGCRLDWTVVDIEQREGPRDSHIGILE